MTHFMKAATAGLGLFLMAAAGTAPAQDGPLGMSGIDANDDGIISAEEGRNFANAQFARLDTNQDGSLSRAEFVDARLAQLSQWDDNGDGGLSRSEMRKHFREARGR